MIYQLDNKFMVIPFTVTIGTDTHLVIDKVEFENMLQMDGTTLPDIVYTENTLTADQQTRLDEVKNIEDISLDEVREYTIDGTMGNLISKHLMLENLGRQLTEEKLKGIMKDAQLEMMGSEITKLKLDIINMKGGAI